DVEQPAKGSHGKQSEKCGHQPEPDFSVTPGLLGRLCLRAALFIGVRSSQPGSHGKGNTAYQRESCAQCIQAVADHSQKEGANNRQIDKGYTCRKQLHRNQLLFSRSFPDKLRCSARKNFFEDLGLEVKLRRILIVTNGNRVGVIRPFQLRFDVFDFVLLHEKKITVKGCWHVSSVVVADSIEVSEHPRERISAGANEVTSQVIVRRIPFSQCKKRVG